VGFGVICFSVKGQRQEKLISQKIHISISKEKDIVRCFFSLVDTLLMFIPRRPSSNKSNRNKYRELISIIIILLYLKGVVGVNFNSITSIKYETEEDHRNNK